MTFQIKTPLLQRSVDLIESAMAGIQDGSVEGRTAGLMISGARGLQSAVAGDIKVRIAAPRILAQEAKLVEQEQNRQQIAA